MPDGDSIGGRHATEDDDNGGHLLARLKRLFFRTDRGQSLREQLEEAIDEHEVSDESSESLADGDLSPVERDMLRNLLHFSEHDVDDVAVPRSEVIAVQDNASFREVVDLFVEHGHSRLPVYTDTLDKIVGMVHIKDFFNILAKGCDDPENWSDLIRQPLFVPQSMGVLDMLADMRSNRTHLAIVVDEFSGTDGIVSIEDLVEEIVGEIEDEHDDEPTEMFTKADNGIWIVDARAELDDVGERIDPKLADVDEDIDTLGGLAFLLAGKVADKGTRLEHESGWTLEVEDSDDRRINRIKLHPPKA
jgi:CBS domain containing-hemolysin-like protein